MFRSFQQVERAGDVRVDVELWLLDRRAHSRARGEVDDGVEFALVENALNRGLVAEIRLVNADRIFHRAEICALDSRVVEIVEIVENADFMPVREEALRKVRADESRSSRH